MSSMLLRVLFSSRPAMLRSCCVSEKKVKKSAMESRCRCARCLLKQRKEKKAVVPVKFEEIDIDWATDSTRSHQDPEEIVLKVTNFQN